LNGHDLDSDSLVVQDVFEKIRGKPDELLPMADSRLHFITIWRWRIMTTITAK
jgi:hypothetical protein